VTYATALALRTALEHHLGEYSQEHKISLDRLRRRVVFERIVVRLETAEPGCWVVKGGMALEVRLRDEARLTKDLDLGLRGSETDAEDLRERLMDALATDPDEDRFVMTVGSAKRCTEDGAGHATWRIPVSADLAGRQFGRIKIDVSPRERELYATDVVVLPTALGFAGIDAREIEIIDVHRHAAEKLHAMQKDFGDRENTRLRDLVDVVLLSEHRLLDSDKLESAVRQVWTERENSDPPDRPPEFPASWPGRYEEEAANLGLETLSFRDAVSVIAALWEGFDTRKEPLG
jgi:predicted nucleotidyltransferase component of viral defense system